VSDALLLLLLLVVTSVEVSASVGKVCCKCKEGAAYA
jgi:hypothetical protein